MRGAAGGREDAGPGGSPSRKGRQLPSRSASSCFGSRFALFLISGAPATGPGNGMNPYERFAGAGVVEPGALSGRPRASRTAVAVPELYGLKSGNGRGSGELHGESASKGEDLSLICRDVRRSAPPGSQSLPQRGARAKERC